MSILAVGSLLDPHVTKIAKKLDALGFDCLIFDVDNPNHLLTINIGENSVQVEFLTPGKYLNMSQVSSVWWRLKPKPYPSQDFYEICNFEFKNKEWRQVLYSLEYFSEASWVNPLRNTAKFNIKPLQLKLAKKTGFRIPETTFTNSPSSVKELLDRNSEIVYKTISSPLIYNNSVVYTSRVSEEMIDSSNENIKIAPGIYQQLIHKSYELRITVVGDKVFPVAIYAKEKSSTNTDWRKFQFDDIFRNTQISDGLREKILKFHRETGLKYAVYDFMQEENNEEPIFLECNPSGQWLWLEDQLSLSITDEIVHLLTHPSLTFSA